MSSRFWCYSRWEIFGVDRKKMAQQKYVLHIVATEKISDSENNWFIIRWKKRSTYNTIIGGVKYFVIYIPYYGNDDKLLLSYSKLIYDLWRRVLRTHGDCAPEVCGPIKIMSSKYTLFQKICPETSKSMLWFTIKYRLQFLTIW